MKSENSENVYFLGQYAKQTNHMHTRKTYLDISHGAGTSHTVAAAGTFQTVAAAGTSQTATAVSI